jgi:hypothetical protein
MNWIGRLGQSVCARAARIAAGKADAAEPARLPTKRSERRLGFMVIEGLHIDAKQQEKGGASGPDRLAI